MEFSGTQKLFLNIFCGVIIGVGVIVLSLNALLLEAIGLCIIGILSIVFFNVRQSRHKKLDVFNAINMEILKGKAFLWGSGINNLNKIVLFRLPFQQYSKLRYVLFFEFNTSTTEGQGSKGMFDGRGWSDDKYPLKDGFKEVYKKKTPDDFFKEWLITTEKPKEVNERLSLILYNKKNT